MTPTPIAQAAPAQTEARADAAAPADRAHDAALQSKQFFTLQARCALAGGYVLRRLADGTFFVSGPGGVTRDFDNLDRIENWLAFVEGRPK